MSSGQPELSVIIPVHNGALYLGEQLEAVRESLSLLTSSELIVVDNKSTDDSVLVVEQWARASGVPVRIVQANQKAGEPHARNVGWHEARSEYIAYCDADDAVSPKWAKSIVNALQENGYATGPLDTRKLNAPEIADLRGESLLVQQPIVHNLVPFAHGCNMGFRRSILESLGGFDETYLIACDIEIAVRAWRDGMSLAWAPDALVHYRLRPTPLETYRQSRAYGRSRHRIAKLVPEAPDAAGEARARARRAVWLIKHLPELRTFRGRSNWCWVAGGMVGELQGFVRPDS